MHELGVTFAILDRLTELASERNIKHINKVILELGEVSTVIDNYLLDCWVWACKKRGELFKDCQLEIQTLHALSFCNSCKLKYDTVKYAKICPNCGSSDTHLHCGNELNIKEIQV